jgi:tetratricopeptide (TPR) repeat protein
MLNELRSITVKALLFGVSGQPYIWYLRLIRRRKDTARLASWLADVAFKELSVRNWRQALFLAKSSVAANPRQSQAHIILGFAYLELGERLRANDAYELAKQASTTDAWTAASLGTLALELGHHVEAEAFCRSALRLAQDDVDLYLRLATAVREQGRLEEAISLLHSALEIDSENIQALIELGANYIEQSKLREAIFVLTRATEIDPGSVLAHYHLGHALSYAERWQEALEEARTALRFQPDDPVLKETVTLFQKGLRAS